jgi:RNA polymerase sigma factor (sigma-70 family)
MFGPPDPDWPCFMLGNNSPDLSDFIGFFRGLKFQPDSSDASSMQQVFPFTQTMHVCNGRRSSRAHEPHPSRAQSREQGQLGRPMLSRSTPPDDTRVGFRQNIMPHLDASYNFARFLSRDADAAQDIVQEAFLRAYRFYDRYRGDGARAWLFTIVRNCYYDWLIERRRKSRLETPVPRSGNADEPSIDDVATLEDSPETALVRKTQSNAVHAVLNALPRSRREMLVLRELEGLSYRQIAEIAALPIGTVMSRLARARREFAEAWQRENLEDDPARRPAGQPKSVSLMTS